MQALKGRKTYLVALGMLGLAIVNYVTGHEPQVDWKLVLEALGLTALRAGVAKIGQGGSLIALLVPLLAFSLPASAADGTQNFRAGEVQIESFGVLDRPDLTGSPTWGAGWGVSYFVTRGLGASVRGIAYSTDDWGGATFDQGEARLLFRAPLWDRVAPYGYVAGIRRFDRGEWGAGAGGGLEFRLTKNVGVFGETGLGITTEGANNWQTSFGFRLAF